MFVKYIKFFYSAKYLITLPHLTSLYISLKKSKWCIKRRFSTEIVYIYIYHNNIMIDKNYSATTTQLHTQIFFKSCLVLTLFFYNFLSLFPSFFAIIYVFRLFVYIWLLLLVLFVLLWVRFVLYFFLLCFLFCLLFFVCLFCFVLFCVVSWFVCFLLCVCLFIFFFIESFF